VANELGNLIGAAVARAETDFKAARDRALSVVGVAGGLVTLVAGFLSIAAGSEKDFLPSGGRWVVVGALLAYVLSTICALWVNLPTDATEASAKDLKKFAEENWDDEGWEQQAAVLSATYLVSLHATNARLATLLSWAIGLEIAGIALTAGMALIVVAHLS
jgi:hypothetical protein